MKELKIKKFLIVYNKEYKKNNLFFSIFLKNK